MHNVFYCPDLNKLSFDNVFWGLQRYWWWIISKWLRTVYIWIWLCMLTLYPLKHLITSKTQNFWNIISLWKDCNNVLIVKQVLLQIIFAKLVKTLCQQIFFPSNVKNDIWFQEYETIVFFLYVRYKYSMIKKY